MTPAHSCCARAGSLSRSTGSVSPGSSMITAFKKLRGYGFIINTSFNLHGRPIVMRPEDAIVDFIDCGLNYLVMEAGSRR